MVVCIRFTFSFPWSVFHALFCAHELGCSSLLRTGDVMPRLCRGWFGRSDANGDEAPHFKPEHEGFHWRRRFVLPTPPGYTVNHPFSSAVDLSIKKTKIPIKWDAKGKAIKWLGGGPHRERNGGRCYVCATRALRFGRKVRTAHFSRWACKHCRVILCPSCWDLFDHERERVPHDLPPPFSDVQATPGVHA